MNMWQRLKDHTAATNQGHVKLDFVLWNIKGSMSCTDTPFNESSGIII